MYLCGEMNLQDKIVVITGVSTGIGRALCLEFLANGAKVMGLGRNSPNFTESEGKSLENFHFFQTDVRNFDNVTKSLQEIVDKFGSEIHILINNAGLGWFGNIEDYPLEQIHTMFETNVYSLFYTCKTVIPLMKKQGYGHIFNIASTAALEGYPQVSAYCGSKYAVKGISESMYKELRDFKIKVTCIYPGSVKTEFFKNVASIQPHDYMLMPEDVAHTIVQAAQMPDNFHQVNIEIRPLQPKGPK